jgi:PKD repeat protein
MEYLWDFDGDGTWDTSISTSPTIDRQYSAAGTYTATLEVIDSGGLSATASETLTVAAQPGGNSAPAAQADVYPAEGVVGDEFEFSFEGSSDAEDPAELLQGRWDFESDGQWDTDYSDNVSHLHTYADPDLYTATVEVQDTGGLTDQATVEVMVGEKRCALSRAADGDPRVLNALRQFRDENLASTSLGRIVIKTYYRASPAISAVLDKSPALRAVVKSLLQRLAP